MQSKCPRNELATLFSISKVWNELYNPRKKRKISPKPLAPMDGWENQRSSQMWWRNEQEHPSPEPRTARTSELNGSGGGRGKVIRGLRPFVPVGVSNRDKRPWPPYPLTSPPARAIQLTCFLLFLAWERGVLAHFFTTFVKIFDSPSIHQR